VFTFWSQFSTQYPNPGLYITQCLQIQTYILIILIVTGILYSFPKQSSGRLLY